MNFNATNTIWAVSGIFLMVFTGCNKMGDKKVYFGNLENHSQVESPFKVEMKAQNLIVEPAIMGIREGAGHFHMVLCLLQAHPLLKTKRTFTMETVKVKQF
jgi:hypothetical protein